MLSVLPNEGNFSEVSFCGHVKYNDVLIVMSGLEFKFSRLKYLTNA